MIWFFLLFAAFIGLIFWELASNEWGNYWRVPLAFVCLLASLAILLVNAANADRAYDRRCTAAGGYTERGRNIELCIDYETGRILRPEEQVER